MKEFLKKYEVYFLLAALITSFGQLVYLAYSERLLYPITASTPHSRTTVMGASLILLMTLGAVMFRMIYRRIMRMERTQNWLIGAVNWNIGRLRDHGLDEIIEKKQVVPSAGSSEVKMHWPWGSHHTETLGHLEAAARRFWTLYDPHESDTAPTNEMVADWLVSERKVSKSKAKAIASMLRPDGLPTGPRT